MTKKIITIILLLSVGLFGTFSCRKGKDKNIDPTKNYFPIVFGKYVTYDVDSIYYVTVYDTTLLGKPDTTCGQIEVKSQLKYAITDTVRDKNDSLMYIVSVFTRHFDGDLWMQEGSVLYLIVKPDSITEIQDGNAYVKMRFPVTEGYSWLGNDQVQTAYPQNVYLNNWSYSYQNMGLSFNNLLHNFANTITVLEDDESINYPYVDGNLTGYRTYAKEVYAYNIGLVYKEWTHITYGPPTTCGTGFTVVMRAVDYN